MNNFDYTLATDEDGALRAIATDPEAMFVAGGTNLIDLWKYNILHPKLLVNVSKLHPQEGITAISGGGLRVSASLTNAATAYHPLVTQRYPLLSKAILAGASPQIRNMATNGGNLLQRTRCYYFYDASVPCNKRSPGSGCPALKGYNRMHAILGTSDHCIAAFPSDMCVALAALNARVNIVSVHGSRTIPFADFHRLPGDTPDIDNELQPGELIISIDLPQNGFDQHYTYLKLRDRHSYAFALVSVAMGFELEDGLIRAASIALGGVAHKPWRVPEAESILIGKPPTDGHFAAAAGLLLDGAKGFGHNDFKIELAKRAIVRAGRMALNPETQLPGAQPSA